MKTEDRSCDLHIHSNFSDSDADLENIFRQAQKKKLNCIAITDHDTVEGIKEARLYSKAYAVELLEGLELSAQHKDTEVHILGYFSDLDDSALGKELAPIKVLRKERLLWMADKLNSLGIAVDKDELLSLVGDAIATRLHMGLYLLKKGRVASLREAFRKFLSPGKPAYKGRFKFSAQEAIRCIKKYGGVAILAHPHIIPDQSYIEELISFDIDGLEVVYPGMSPDKSSFYKNIVIKSGLLKSGGSDAHGSYKEFIEIGAKTIPYSWVEDIKNA